MHDCTHAIFKAYHATYIPDFTNAAKVPEIEILRVTPALKVFSILARQSTAYLDRSSAVPRSLSTIQRSTVLGGLTEYVAGWVPLFRVVAATCSPILLAVRVLSLVGSIMEIFRPLFAFLSLYQRCSLQRHAFVAVAVENVDGRSSGHKYR